MGSRLRAPGRRRSDEQLVAAFRGGDEAAFALIHARHARRLHAVAARTLRGHGGDPEGVVQEAFVRAHAALRADDRPMDLAPWLGRLVRNGCLDELRRRPGPAGAPLELLEHDGAGRSDDEGVLAALTRREELRRLVEDLADLPERQRAALLMRELDGLSHERVAASLDVSPATSRQLVARARAGLVAAAAARDADCAEVREALLAAHDERRRPAEAALRHAKGCPACAAFRADLKATRARLRALVPPIGLGPLAGLLPVAGGGAAATGAGAGGTGLAAKAALGGCCALLAAGGGALALREGETRVVRGAAAPGTEAGGRQLVGRPIRRGTPLPRSVAIPSTVVTLPASPAGAPRAAAPPRTVLRVRCPAGMVGAGLAEPRRADEASALALLRQYQYGDRDADRLAAGRGRREVAIVFRARPGLAAPVRVRVGTLCRDAP